MQSGLNWGEKASYYSAVCLETGEVEVVELEEYSNAQTYTAFLRQLRDKQAGSLKVIWDNAPAHHDDALRAYLTSPGLRLLQDQCFAVDLPDNPDNPDNRDNRCLEDLGKLVDAQRHGGAYVEGGGVVQPVGTAPASRFSRIKAHHGDAEQLPGMFFVVGQEGRYLPCLVTVHLKARLGGNILP